MIIDFDLDFAFSVTLHPCCRLPWPWWQSKSNFNLSLLISTFVLIFLYIYFQPLKPLRKKYSFKTNVIVLSSCYTFERSFVFDISVKNLMQNTIVTFSKFNFLISKVSLYISFIISARKVVIYALFYFKRLTISIPQMVWIWICR